MMRFRMLLLFVLALALGACVPIPVDALPTTAASTATRPPATADLLAGTSWQLISFSTSGSESPALPSPTITLDFQFDGRAGGQGGCNSYGGSYSVQDDSLVFGQVVSTLRACADQSVTEQEQRYLSALRTASQFELNGDTLTITNGGGTGVLSFVRASAAAAASTPAATPAPLPVTAEPPVSTAEPAPTAAPTAARPTATATATEQTPTASPSPAAILEAPTATPSPVLTEEPQPATPAAVEPPERVQFTRGTTGAQVSSLMASGPGIKQYALYADAGQTMTIELTSGGVSLGLTITSPAGVQRFVEMAPGNGGYLAGHSFTLTESGDYVVTLTKADHTPSTNHTVGFTIR